MTYETVNNTLIRILNINRETSKLIIHIFTTNIIMIVQVLFNDLLCIHDIVDRF